MFVPDKVTIPFVCGDGIGPLLVKKVRSVLDQLVNSVYHNERQIIWHELLCGEQAAMKYDGDWFPQETVSELEKHKIGLIGPITSPIGHGFRSLNIALRHEMRLFASQTRVQSYNGKYPIKCTIIRDNSEDLPLGIEWAANSDEANDVANFLSDELGVNKLNDFENIAFAVKSTSQKASTRLAELAINCALTNQHQRITVVHQANKLPYTEGAFLEWFKDLAMTKFGFKEEGALLQNHTITINFMSLERFTHYAIHSPELIDIVVACNHVGDIIEDLLLSLADSNKLMNLSNRNETTALFEMRHGPMPHIQNTNQINPTSALNAAVDLLQYIGWHPVAEQLEAAIVKANEHHLKSGLPFDSLKFDSYFKEALRS